MKTTTLKSELAGTWYPEDADLLAGEIDTYLASASAPRVEDLIALVLPHAGYRYSGVVAAHGIQQLQNRAFKRVIAMGPSHRVAMLHAVSAPDVDGIETPLGRVEVDRAALERLWTSDVIQSHPHAHAGEHSVQIELPFLQRALGEFKLIPLICGELDAESAAEVGKALLPEIDAETLVVVSTDFTHYGRAFDYVPFTDDIQRNLERLDMGAFRLIEQRDLNGFLRYIQQTGATICGRSPVAVLLSMMGEDAATRLLKYDTSGNLTGDWARCVSYVSAAVSGSWRKVEAETAETPPRAQLSPADKTALLALARRLITQKSLKTESDVPFEPTPATREVMGAFVTLHKHGRLRGCVGEIFPRRPLHAAVAEQAINAAFHDARFPALREDELRDIDIEISALTPPRRVRSIADIEIGRHGVVLDRGFHSAVFLPQVAPEQGWDRATTLSHLAEKAGLGSDDWKTGCEFHVFEAIVFGEKD